MMVANVTVPTGAVLLLFAVSVASAFKLTGGGKTSRSTLKSDRKVGNGTLSRGKPGAAMVRSVAKPVTKTTLKPAGASKSSRNAKRVPTIEAPLWLPVWIFRRLPYFRN